MQVGNLSTPARSRALFAVVGMLVALLIGGGLIWITLIAPQLRQATVAARGAAVMPFDLERTTHVFEPTVDGGIQQVRADDPADSEQIALIRSHLQEAAQRFQQGDFGDPAAIHGAAMPGLAELEQGAARIAITYTNVPDGAELRYVTGDPALVDALHRWFQAQLSDHGDHALDHSGH